MTNNEYNIDNTNDQYTGVKVSQFSFNRLANADSRLGVEMLSTGEVACFGKNYYEAYLKALSATGFKVKNNCNVILSIGSYQNKKEMHDSVQLLANAGFKLYGTHGTANYYSESNVDVIGLDNDDVYKNKDGFWISCYFNSKQNRVE